ncbi:MAG: DUF2520 domain-containing protein [Flavobacteriales bacterium]|nr:DUF2520 domain-containing protein [Flavobacteriales bacterium]
MKIGFIGAGKVGLSFGRYLVNNNIRVSGYFSKSPSSAKGAAQYTGTNEFTTIDQLLHASEIIFITTPDDVIKSIAEELSKLSLSNQIFVHMSGALASEELKDIKLKGKGCSIASLHPLQAFANIEQAVVNLKNTLFTLEGDHEAVVALKSIVELCGNEYAIIEAEKKALYHSAACVVSNYMVTLLDIGERLFQLSGISKDISKAGLLPLLYSSLENYKGLGGEEALTGPIARGDLKTLIKHMEAIQSYCPELKDFYSSMGRETLELAARKKLRATEAVTAINNLWRDNHE